MSASYAICLLAGGQARRMGGGDKAEIKLEGKSILAHLIERFSDAPYLFLNANGDAARFASYRLDVIPDILPDYQGPLSGIYAAMSHIRAQQADMKWLVILPTDAPLLPAAIADDMLAAAHLHKTMAVSVMSNNRRHPVIGLWSLDLFEALEEALITRGIRKIDQFTDEIGCHYLTYDESPDPFMNLNRPEDVQAYHEAIKELK